MDVALLQEIVEVWTLCLWQTPCSSYSKFLGFQVWTPHILQCYQRPQSSRVHQSIYTPEWKKQKHKSPFYLPIFCYYFNCLTFFSGFFFGLFPALYFKNFAWKIVFTIPIFFLIHEEKFKVSRIHAFSKVIIRPLIELVLSIPSLDICSKLILESLEKLCLVM